MAHTHRPVDPGENPGVYAAPDADMVAAFDHVTCPRCAAWIDEHRYRLPVARPPFLVIAYRDSEAGGTPPYPCPVLAVDGPDAVAAWEEVARRYADGDVWELHLFQHDHDPERGVVVEVDVAHRVLLDPGYTIDDAAADLWDDVYLYGK